MRQRLQVFHRRRFFLHEVAQRGVLALERPGDEGREAAGVFLNLADDFEVVHALLDGLAAAEHHGRRGAHAQRVRGAVDVHPLLRRALQAADALPHVVVEDFGAAAGNGIETRVAQPGDGVAQDQPAHFGDVDDFRRGEAVAARCRETFVLIAAQQVLVPLDLQVRVQAALHQHAGAAQVERLLNLVEDHFVRSGRSLLRGPCGR